MVLNVLGDLMLRLYVVQGFTSETWPFTIMCNVPTWGLAPNRLTVPVALPEEVRFLRSRPLCASQPLGAFLTSRTPFP